MDSTDNSAFAEKLLATFRIEAQEHLAAITAGLLELEKPISTERHAAVVESVFRETHSLKGAARSVNLSDIERLCQALEEVFSAAKRGALPLTREIFDRLHDGISVLETLLSGPEPEIRIARKKSRDLIPVLKKIAVGTPPAQGQAVTSPTKPTHEAARAPEPERSVPALPGIPTDVIRISTAKLDTLMLLAEEMGDAERAAAQRLLDIDRIYLLFPVWRRHWAGIRTRLLTLKRSVRSADIEEYREHAQADRKKIAEFLDYNAEFIQNIESELAHERIRARTDHQFLRDRTELLIDDMKGLLMVPAGTLLELFPRFVRELSRDKGKDVDLIIKGQEIMIDRRILDEMKDAFIHLLRNAIDHGIESPDLRQKKGKSQKGTIGITFTYREGKNVEILVSDDGAGVDPAQIREAAERCKILAQDDLRNYHDDNIIPLIFQSGVTTSRIITDTSGRGLGLAIVAEKVNKLGGSITVDSKPDRGTTFLIRLPLTLATFKGLIVHDNRQTFVFPLKDVERVVRINPEAIKTIENQAVIEIQDEPVAVIRLSELLGVSRNGPAEEIRAIFVVVVMQADKRLGISVDEIGYSQDVMVKALGQQLVRVNNFSSATVLGTGKVVPIVNVGDLMRSAVSLHSGGATKKPLTQKEILTEKKQKNILVTEDSITSRMLLKNILESGGYHVETAVDGMDAFTKLRSMPFDIVVSDVDMPRMNGFVLTEKIRSDKQLSDIPVVLVTSLDSQQDREHGIEVGANAYIVKSSFDESNLIEVVQRLIGK